MGLLSLEKTVAVLATVLKCVISGHREERRTFLREAPQEDERRQPGAAGKNILTAHKKKKVSWQKWVSPGSGCPGRLLQYPPLGKLLYAAG